ncbi:GNAT family N-acetyltransferase [Catellatospora sp. NPDC049609]|uniref:GNAT family N-acetyltransferase n=1 Tax=Catellatospora sp. NPDC049609 TaxID=3155505 RepID=UPI00343A9D7C
MAGLNVSDAQRAWVAEATYYLALCHYSPTGWRPLAVYDQQGEAVGFLMWAVDPEDASVWLGGIMIDGRRQGQGLGRAAVTAAIYGPVRAGTGSLRFRTLVRA